MISVVIPTIGEEILHKVIKKLLNGRMIPNEILLVFFKQEKKNVSSYSKYKNTKILFCPFKGQVNQRIFGFRNAKNKYVVQLDSDILVNINTIELLYKEAIKDNKTCVSAKIVNKDLLKTETKINQNNSGKITKWGSSIWFNKFNYPLKIQECEWLQGGCVIHLKENLITNNYYPYKGKAYGEDVIHSCLLRKNKIKLILNPKIKVIEIAKKNSISTLNIYDFYIFIKNNFLSKIKIIKLTKGSYLLFFLWFLLFYLKRKFFFIMKIDK